MLCLHAGVRNDFLVNLGTEAAVRYNDMSVNENGHAALAFETLTLQANNFVAHMSLDERRFFRRMVISIVLSTDMSVHDEQLKVGPALPRHGGCTGCVACMHISDTNAWLHTRSFSLHTEVIITKPHRHILPVARQAHAAVIFICMCQADLISGRERSACRVSSLQSCITHLSRGNHCVPADEHGPQSSLLMGPPW